MGKEYGHMRMPYTKTGMIYKELGMILLNI